MMELFAPIILDGALLGAIVLVPIAAILALRKRYRNGALLGVISMVLQVVFEWLWYSAFVRPGDGRNWAELAFARANTVEITILMCGLLVTSVNILLLIKQRFSSTPAVQS